MYIDRAPAGWIKVSYEQFRKAMKVIDYRREAFGNCVYIVENGKRIGCMMKDVPPHEYYLNPERFRFTA